MIVQWGRYQKTAKEIKSKMIKETITEEPNWDIKQGIKTKKSINNQPSDDYHLEPYTRNTSSTTNLFANDFRESNSEIDLSMSSICSLSSNDIEENKSNYEDGSFNYCLLHQLKSLFNSDSFDSNYTNPSNVFLIQNFPKAISNQYLFNCLIEKFNANPPLFLQNYFELMITYSIDIITSQISHSIIVKSITYFTLDQLATFLSKVIKRYFTCIIKNQYGIIVLNQFITDCISFDKSLLISLIKLVIANFSNIITDATSSKIIHSLMSLNIPSISKTVIEAIGNNSLSTALSPNGVHITRTFINSPTLRGLIIGNLLDNFNVILVHHNGPKVIELLFSLKINNISVFIINCLLSNIAFLSDTNFFLLLIEKTILSLDAVSVAQIQKTISDPLVTDCLIKNQTGIRIIKKANQTQFSYFPK